MHVLPEMFQETPVAIRDDIRTSRLFIMHQVLKFAFSNLKNTRSGLTVNTDLPSECLLAFLHP